MMPGVDPQQLAALQQVMRNIKAELRVNYRTNSLNLQLSATEPQAQEAIASLLEQLSGQLSIQLNSFFGIQGEIIETKA